MNQIWYKGTSNRNTAYKVKHWRWAATKRQVCRKLKLIQTEHNAHTHTLTSRQT